VGRKERLAMQIINRTAAIPLFLIDERKVRVEFNTNIKNVELVAVTEDGKWVLRWDESVSQKEDGTN
jgi:hypothetical protein